ncbi:MAG TPA: RNA-binding domain-containing protein [Negativicutes bacterium]|nr:RNA-binding domain-containing protein [Negativicutes bacterium]
MTILEQIARGEGKTLEFKESLPASERLAKSIIAFANTGGGKILIGVKDEGEIVGIDNSTAPDYMDRISNMAHDLIHPLIAPDIYAYSLQDMTIIVVEVYPSSLKPHFLKNRGKATGVYIRVGATNKQADPEYIQELERQKLNISFDEDRCVDCEDESGDIKDLKQLLMKQLRREITDETLTNLKFLKVQQGKLRLTNAVPILMGTWEYVHIKCARFKGDNSDVFIDRKELTGDLFSQLENAMKFLLANINLSGEVGADHLRRVDSYEIPPEALREALVNAIVHRDYVMSGSDIKVAVYDSRIEITSPGAFPRGITLDEVLDGRSEVRNKVIARVFKEAELIEQWGRGIQKLTRLCLEAGLQKPDIVETGMFVQVTFHRKNRTQKPDAKIGRKNRTQKSDVNEKTVESQNKIMVFVLEQGAITVAQGMELLSLGKSRTSEILSSMVQTELLTKQGLGKATRYISGTASRG